MADLGLRLRAVVDRRYDVVVAVLVLLAVAGGIATADAYASPDVRPEERTVSAWQASGQYSHQATVVNDTLLFQKGAVLRNRTVYYRGVMPVLNGTSRFAYTGAPSGSADVRTTIRLVVESVDPSTDRQVTYWQFDRTLARATTRDVSPNEPVEVEFSVRMAELMQRTEEIRAELGSSRGKVRMHLISTARVTGTMAGTRENRTFTWQLTIVPGSSAYEVRGSEQTKTYERTKTVMVVDRDPVRSVGGPLLLLGGLGGLVSVQWARREDRLTLTPEERAVLRFEDDRSDFEEWISRIALPDDLDGSEAEADSLEDLVNFAIDADEAVIEDPTRGAYFVFHDGQRYAYYPPGQRPGDERTAAGRPTDGEGTAAGDTAGDENGPPN